VSAYHKYYIRAFPSATSLTIYINSIIVGKRTQKLLKYFNFPYISSLIWLKKATAFHILTVDQEGSCSYISNSVLLNLAGDLD